MRVHKYRAWDNNINEMLIFNGIFNIIPYTEKSTFPQYESFPEYHKLELMQYTGLLDKNGKEIFEGDIIKEQNSLKRKLTEVFFCDGSFMVYINDAQYLELSQNSFVEDMKVIGNRYENPKLLNKCYKIDKDLLK